VHLQSFETTNLRWLREHSSLPLVQLVAAEGAPWDCQAVGDPTTYDDLVTPSGLRAVSRYADALAVSKDRLIPRLSLEGPAADAKRLVDDAHLAGLRVLAYSVRNENRFLAACYRTSLEPDAFGDVLGETRALLDLEVDGLFTDQPDTSVLVREIWSSTATR